MNIDRLSMVPAHGTVQTAYAALTGSQDSPAPMQVMGFALLFFRACTVLRLDPSQMLDAARRVSSHAADHYSVELRALDDYIRKELNK